MGETDKDLVYSENVKAGKRIYYFDVKQSRNGDKYIAITESKKINEGTFENPRFVYEKHKLFLYKEDYEKFVDALSKTLKVAKGEMSVEEAEAEKEQAANSYAEAKAAAEPAPQDAPAEEPAAEEEQAEKAEKKSFLDKMKDIF
ncbi:MAG: DUF3276 family protein [Prevotellaceae bacterium]|nr:DUF3276 family protein [Prevotellaceae bacterium]